MATLPNPNPIPNSGYLGYDYQVVPGTTISNGITSNIVNTQVNTAIIQNSDGGLIKSLDNTYVTIGSTITYTVVLKNTGNVNATSVNFLDTIPTYTSYVAGSATVNGVAAGTSPDLGINVGTIAPNGVATVVFKVTVVTIPTTTNTVPNSALINYNFVYDPSIPASSSATNLSNEVNSYINVASIVNTKTVTPTSEANIGDIITYTITMQNVGNTIANSVVLKDTIPSGTSFQSNQVTVNGTPVTGNPQTGINLGSLAPGATAVAVFTVLVVSIPASIPIPNQAITNYNYTMNPSIPNGQAVVAPSNIVTTSILSAIINTTSGGLNKAVNLAYAAIGDTITYTVVLKNTGNITANNVNFTDTVPNGTTLLQVLVNGTVVPGGNPNTGISLGNIAPNATDTVTIQVVVNTIPTPNPIPNSGTVNYNYTVDGLLRNDANLTNIVTTTVAQARIMNGDGGLVKSVDKTNAKVGDTISYTIVLKNTGNVNATGVTFTDTVPGGTSLVPNSVLVNGAAATGNLTSGVTIGTLVPNGVATVTFSVILTTIPTVNPIPNDGIVNYSYLVDPLLPPRTSTQISNQVLTSVKMASISNADGGLTKSVDIGYAKVGDILTYTIPVKNTGNVQADNVVIIDTIPSGTSFVPGSLYVNGVANPGNIGTGLTLGTINAGSTDTVTFQVLVTTIPTPNPIPNSATANYNFTVSTLDDTTGQGVTNIVQTTIAQAYIRNSDGGLTKSVDLAYADVGQTVTYTVVLKNTGNVPAALTTLYDTIPTGTSFIANTATVNGVANAGTPSTGIPVGTLNAGAVATVVFKVMVTTIPTPNPLVNAADVAYSYAVGATTIAARNTSNAVNTQVNTATITNTKSVNLTSADINQILTYTISISNTGNVNATNVLVKDTIPNGTTYVAGSLTVNGVPNAGTINTGINIGTIAPSGASTVVFKVQVNTIPTPNPIPNTGIVTYSYLVNPTGATTTKTDLSNQVNTQVNTARITNADGSLIKAVDLTNASVGETLTYTIVLKNTGNVPANNIVFTDTVPTDTAYVNGSSSVDGVPSAGTPTTGINVGTIAPNGVATVVFKVTVSTIPTPNPIPNQGLVNYNYVVDTIVGTTNSQSNLTNIVNTQVSEAYIRPDDGGLTKTVDKAYAALGETVTYTIVMKNTGNVVANNVTLIDTIPTYTSYVPNSLTVNGAANAGNIQTGVNVGNINPNAVVTVIFKVNVVSIPSPNPILNQGVVNYTFPVGTTTQSSSYLTPQVPTTVSNASITNTDGGLIKAVDKGYAQIGDTLTYTITLKNTGNITADNIVLKDTVPAAATFVAGSVTIDGAPSASSPLTGISVPSIAPGNTSVVVFNAIVTTIPVPNPINNQATVAFAYTVNPSVPNGVTGAGISNIVPTTINTAIIAGSPNSGIVKSVDLAYADVGQTITYTIVLKNTGNVSANNVNVIDTVPNGTTFVANSVTVNGVVQSNNPTSGITVGTIPAAGTATITFKVVVNTIPSPNPIPNDSNVTYSYIIDPVLLTTGAASANSNQVTTQVNTAVITTTDGGLLKAVDKTSADVGQTVTYTITVSNTGNVNATNVLVKDTIPNDTSYIAGSLTVNGTPNAGSISTGINIGTVAPNGVSTVQFQVKVLTIPNPNPIPNTGLITYSYLVNPTGTTTTKNALTNQVNTQVNTARISNVDGGLVKSVDMTNAAVGWTVTYTIVLKNTGNVDANNIVITDTIPNDTTYVGGSSTVNGTPNSGNPTAGITVGTIAPNGVSTVQFKVTINTIPTPNPIPNQALVNYNYVVDTIVGTTDSQSNLSNIVNTQVSQAYITTNDGGLSKAVDKSYADIGNILTYTMVLKNTGNVTATNVLVKDTIPTGTSYLSGSLKVNGVTNAGNIQTGVSIGSINALGVSTVQFQVVVDTIPTPNPIPNQGIVGYSFMVGTITDGAINGTNIVTTTVARASIDNSDGGLIKATSLNYATVGDTITYTLTLKNTGNVSANNVVLKDTIPAETTFITGSATVNGIPTGGTPSTGIPVGTVGAGQTAIVTFNVRVTSIPASNPITNQGSVSFNYTVSPTIPNGATGIGLSNIVPTTINTAVIPSYPNNGIVKSVDKAYADIGYTITYTVVLKNTGNTQAINVTLQDTVPNGTTFIPGSVTVNGAAGSGAPNTGISVNTIPVNGVATVTFKVIVNTLPTPNPIPNDATVNYNYLIDPTTGRLGNGSDVSNQVTTKVNSAIITAPTGGLIKNVDYVYANVGQTITYTILLSNSGNQPALNVTFLDTAPNGTVFVPGTVYINGVNAPGSNPNTGIFVGNLQPFSANTVTFQVQITTIPTPNPIPNFGIVGYSYIVDPTTNIPTNVSFPSNTVTTQVNNASINGTTGGVIKSVDKAYSFIGDTITYTVALKNTGNVNAINVLFRDTLPLSTALVSNSITVNGVVNGGANLTTGIPIGTMPPNVVTTISFKVTVTDTIPVVDPIPNNAIVDYQYIVDQITQIPVSETGISNTVKTQVNAAVINNPEGGLTKAVNKTYVDLGNTITYTVVIENTGNTTATNLFFIDTIPAETTFIINSVTVNGAPKLGVYPQTGFGLQNLAPGNLLTVSFNVTVSSIPAVNPIQNAAYLGFSYVNDPSLPSINTGALTNTVVNFVNRAVIDGPTNGSLVKAVDLAYGSVGSTVTYTINVKNVGDVAANNLFIQDTIPNYTSFVAGSVVVNGIPSISFNPQTGINLGTLNAGSQAVIQFKAIITTIPPTNVVTNSANSSYTYTVDPSIPNGGSGAGTSNIVTTTIGTAVITGPPGTSGANNSGTKTASPSPANIGDTVTFTMAVYNAGNITANNLIVYDTVPTGTIFITNSVSVDGVSQPASNPNTGMNVGTVTPSQTRTVTFKVLVTTLINPITITNQASVVYNFTTDPSVPNGQTGGGVTNVATVPINTATFGNLTGQSGLVKVVDKTFAAVGDTVTYTITVTNLGNVTANSVLFQDTVPNGTQYIQNSLTINGVVDAGANPTSGVNLGNIAAGASSQVAFKVLVLTIPTPNPFTNEAILNYNYNVSPTDNRTGTDLSNKVSTKVNTAIIGPPVSPGNPNGSGILKIGSPSNADIGTTVTYTLNVTNTGNVSANNVIVNDIIPVGTTFITNSVIVNGTSQPGLIPTSGINLGNINPGATSTIEFKVLVVSIPSNNVVTNKPSGSFSYTVDPSVPDGATANFGGNVVTIPVNNANIDNNNGGLIKNVDLLFVTNGDTITYTIVLKNTGSVNANNVVVYDTIPNGTSYIANSIKVNGATQNASNPQTGITVGTIAPNAVSTVIFSVKVTTVPNPNPIPNTADVAYNYNVDALTTIADRNTSNQVLTQMNYVDVSGMTKVGTPNYVKLGDTVNYTITIPNTGNVSVNNVVVYDTVPFGSSFVVGSVNVNGSNLASANPQTGINVGTIVPNGMATVSFNVVVTTVPASGILQNVANSSYTFTKDPSVPNGVTGTQTSNISTVSVTNASIVGPPGTSGANNGGTKTASPSNADIGTTITYTVLLYNSGNVAANNVTITETLPACTSFIQNSVTVNGSPNSGSPVTGINVGTINPGITATVTYNLMVTCLPVTSPASVVNVANVSYNFTTDPTKPPTSVTNPTNVSTVPINTASFGNLNGQNGLVKSVDKAYASKGDIVTYTVDLTNVGNTSANNVVFIDTIPNDTSFVLNSVTVDGVTQTGSNPGTGIALGSIIAGGTREIIFKVLVLTVPTPNPIPNNALVNYTYTVNPSVPNGTSGSNLSNKVITQVNTAIIGPPGPAGTNTGSGILKTANPSYADIGTTVTYTFALTNTGNVVAQNVIAYDTIPTGSTFINGSVYVNGTNQPTSNPQAGISIGNINPGMTSTVTFMTMVVSIPASKNLVDTPTVDYSYTVDPSLPNIDVVGGGNTVTIPVNNANISTNGGGLNKTATPSYVTVGQTITYTVIATNTGSVAANSVTVFDTLQNGVSFVTGSVTVNGVPKGTASPIAGINLGTLNPNIVNTVIFTALVTTMPNPNPITNTANVSYTYSPTPGVVVPVTNPTNTTTTQTNQANINNMDKTSNVDYVKLGDIITYTITIPNIGNVSANNVMFYDTIPTGTNFIANSVVVNGAMVSGVNPQNGVNIGSIAPSSSSVVKFSVQAVTVPASGIIPNQAGATYTFTIDPAVPNGGSGSQISNVDTVTVTQASIVGPPGTAGANNNGTKTPNVSSVDIGDVVTYTLSLYNSGNVAATNVLITETLPACTTLVANTVSINGVNTNQSPVTGINVGTIPAGATTTVKYSLQVTCLPTTAPASIVNVANVSYNFVTDPSLPPTTVTGPTNVSTIPVLTASFRTLNGQNGLVKLVDKAFANRGDTVTYTVDLTNVGNTTANNVTFIDTIPNGTQYIVNSLSVNGAIVNGANPGTGVSIGNIVAGGTAQVIFSVTVLTIPNPNPIPNNALVNYTYTVNPSIPNGKSGSDLSNQVLTQVNTATIGPPTTPGSPNGSGVLKSANPMYADIGTTVTYTLVLTNTGNVVAKNVVAFDNIAIGSTFVNGSVYVNSANQPSANPETGISVGNINPGMTSTITFMTMVVSIPTSKVLTDTPSVNYSYTVDPSLPDVNATGGGNTVTIPVNNAKISTTDGGLIKSASPSYVTVGSTITYTVSLKNTGSVNATSVKVFDTLQSGIVFVPGSVKYNGTTLGAESPISGIAVGTLAPNVLNTVTFNAIVTTMPNPNPITNTANVGYNYSPAPGVVVPVTNPSNTTTTPANLANINNMNKTSDVDYVKIGDIITYTITIPNIGNVSADNVVIYDTIPTGTNFVAGSVVVNGSPLPSANPQTGVNVGSISAGSSAVVQFKVQAMTVPASGIIPNQASASYNYTVDPANPDAISGKQISNVDTVTVTNASIVGPPGTAGANNNGTKTGSPSPVDIGDTVTYTILLYNSGNTPATNVVVSDTVPTCSTLVNGSVKVNGVVAPNQISNILVGTIAAGQTVTVNYNVKVTCLPTTAPASLVNQANISYKFTTDPSLPQTSVTGPTNVNTIPVNTASFGLVNGQNGLVKTVDKAYANKGDILTYTVNLTNVGNTAANNVNFIDTIPNDTLFIVNSLSVNGAIVTGGNPGTGVSLGNIPAGGTSQVIFKVQVLTVPNPNPIPNNALVNYTYTVTPSVPNGKSGSNLSNGVLTQVNTAIIGPPSGPGTSTGSGVLKTANPMYADIGTTVTYTLVLANTGNTVAKNVVVFDTIAIGSTFINGSVYVNSANAPSENPETGIAVGNINPGSTSTVTFMTMVVSIPASKSLTDTPSVNYSYTVDPSLPDVNTTGGGNTVTIPVNNAKISPTDGGLNKIASPSFVSLGDTITYTIALKNTGSVNATSVTVFDTLQNGVVFVPGSVKFNSSTLGAASPISGINVGTLAPNVLNTVTFMAVVNTIPVPNPITNTANVSYSYSPSPGVVVPVTNPILLKRQLNFWLCIRNLKVLFQILFEFNGIIIHFRCIIKIHIMNQYIIIWNKVGE